jgi:hypothetical protein
MKRILFVITLCVLVSSSAPAMLVVEFSPGTGNWYYDGNGTLSISPIVLVDRGLSSVFDALVTDGATITLPSSFMVGGAGTAGPYTLVPMNYGVITIEGSGGLYFTGILGMGDLVPVTPTSTLGGAYTAPAMDITGYAVTAAGLALGSNALNAIAANIPGMLDFDLVFSGAVVGFRNMLENNLTGSDNFSGSITIPEPATLMMLGLGGLALLRRRK